MTRGAAEKLHRAAPSAAGRPLRWPSDRAYRTMHAPQVRWRRPACMPRCHRTVRRAQRNSVPEIRPFRALRYDPEVGRRPRRQVVAPPYDVIGPDLHRALLARHPRNAVRLDLPAGEPGEDPDERYRRVARTLAGLAVGRDAAQGPAARRSTCTSRPTGCRARTSSGRSAASSPACASSRSGPGASVLPHERTLSGPRRTATGCCGRPGINTSPVVGLYEDAARDAPRPRWRRSPRTPGRGPHGRRRRAPPPVGRRRRGRGHRRPRVLSRPRAAGPVFIADGHHRYETAVRYRDERRVDRTGEQDPAFDFLLMLFLDAADQLTVLPTHRVVRGLGDDGAGRGCVEGLPRAVRGDAGDGR